MRELQFSYRAETEIKKKKSSTVMKWETQERQEFLQASMSGHCCPLPHAVQAHCSAALCFIPLFQSHPSFQIQAAVSRVLCT